LISDLANHAPLYCKRQRVHQLDFFSPLKNSPGWLFSDGVVKEQQRGETLLKEK
jgi:hypothetical protein